MKTILNDLIALTKLTTPRNDDYCRRDNHLYTILRSSFCIFRSFKRLTSFLIGSCWFQRKRRESYSAALRRGTFSRVRKCFNCWSTRTHHHSQAAKFENYLLQKYFCQHMPKVRSPPNLVHSALSKRKWSKSKTQDLQY